MTKPVLARYIFGLAVLGLIAWSGVKMFASGML
jgi:hypothetical protein